jgi:stage II sporulation protein M
MKRENFFARNYKSCWKFLNESRWHMVFALGFFMLTFLIGFVFPIFFVDEIIGFINELIASLEGMSAIELIGYIFWNNLKASFFAIVLGVTFGILPLVILVTNGYLLGLVSRLAVNERGILTMWQLLPHGIFELPAIIISIGIGIKIGADMFKGDVKKGLNYNFREGFRFFVFVVLPLLFVAAIIEGLLIWLVAPVA